MIQSMSNNKVKELNKLNKKKHRLEEGKFLVEGYHLVEEAKKAGYLLEVLSTEDYDFENVTLVDRLIIEKLSKSKSPQDVIGVCKMIDKNIQSDKILILDDISDPGNFGTLLRSAVGFGFEKIIVSKDTCDEYNDKVIRSSQGAIFHVDIVRGDLVSEIKALSEYKIIGTDLKGKTNYEDTVEKIALVLGNESRGMSEEVKEYCDEMLLIEINKIESLNVAIAGSILMHMIKN
ncbi:RNA methyltransferase [Mycoplasmatota bacterium WC44]